MRIFFTAFAISLTIVSRAQFVALDTPVDTQLVNISDPAETAHLYWNVVNVSGSTKMVGCRREMIVAVPGTEHQFCWDVICYPYSNESEETPIADFVTIGNGDTVLFAASYRHFGVPGMSVVKHCWFTTSGDSMCFETRYCSDPTCSVMASQSELLDENSSFKVSPNPVAETAMIYLPKTVTDGSAIEIYNSTGQRVKSLRVNSGTGLMFFGVEDLSQGTYLLSLVNPNGMRSSQRIVVGQK